MNLIRVTTTTVETANFVIERNKKNEILFNILDDVILALSVMQEDRRPKPSILLQYTKHIYYCNY